ncbi:chord-domain-containing protein [Auriscalpium vulgare]|uniref:Chord-domain-containing protein n=1 Tax=Auriscalpium vulgare TaxID=40419 RepID=A0ACB8S492_9AGAM|nr:chord-domain-containing protein [Auriscalpium vulgare]
MPRCSHQGCGKDFDVADNAVDGCVYHAGGPIFHEGLKSWSCCDAVNKPVLTFDEFMNIPGCTRGPHNADAPKPDPPKPAAKADPSVNVTRTSDGKEVYTTSAALNAPAKANVPTPGRTSTPAPPVEEEDDLDAAVPAGTECRRNGCKVQFVSDEENRKGDDAGAICVYHPAQPIFHEGSKGYFCCKRRVLEFDEFLKIEGCKKGRHVFIPKSRKDTTEELVNCRIDHYQTQTAVNVTVYAKQADKDLSVVTFEENSLHLNIVLPNSKRFTRSLELFGAIDPAASTSRILGTKIEIILKKSDGKSWTLLERTDRDLGGVSLTFGVGGRTGTIGAKELVLDGENSRRTAA